MSRTLKPCPEGQGVREHPKVLNNELKDFLMVKSSIGIFLKIKRVNFLLKLSPDNTTIRG